MFIYYRNSNYSKMTSATTEELMELLNEHTPLYDDINRLIVGYAERFIFKEGDVIYDPEDVAEGPNVKYIIQKKTKHALIVYKCIDEDSIPFENIVNISKVNCEYLVHYKSIDYEKTGNIMLSSFNRKKYFIYIIDGNLVFNKMDTKTVRRKIRYTDVMDEYITTLTRRRPLYARTDILKEVDEIVNDMNIQTNLNM